MTFLEIFPVGLIMTLIAAGFLRPKKILLLKPCYSYTPRPINFLFCNHISQ